MTESQPRRLAFRDEAAVPLLLRDAVPDDASRLAALHVQCWIETYSGLVEDQIIAGLSVGNRTAGWARQIGALPPSGRILLLEVGTEMVGFGVIGGQRNGSLARQGYDGEISALYLLEAWQGLGLGTRLFRTLATSLVERNFRNLSLWVLSDNRKALGFYRQMGGANLPSAQGMPTVGGSPEVALGWRDLARRYLMALPEFQSAA